MSIFSDLPKVKIRTRISSTEILLGKPVPKLDRLRGMNEDDFEDMINEWATDFLRQKYNGKVKRFGGAGDKGRDVVGYYDDGSIDIYQCKHYGNVIAPYTMWVEFGKICYYSFKNVYPVPKQYVIVSPHGVGSKLQGLIDSPEELKEQLIVNWQQYCQSIITKKEEIVLEGKFRKFVEKFDFSIVSSKEPLPLIEEHQKTRYHAMRFGGGLITTRDNIPKAGGTIEQKELKYVSQLFKVYSEELDVSIENKEILRKSDLDLFNHFNEQRNGFYSAESLERFSRDNFPDSDPLPFNEIKKEAYNVINNTLILHRKSSGLDRLTNCVAEILRQSFSSNALVNEIRSEDKCGLCHHFANEDKIQWIKNE